MKFPRSAGILLHPTSLPGTYGIGELGEEAFRFASFLHGAGIKIWQVLPLNPTGYGDSPYQSLSAFAGNPLLISLETLLANGLVEQSDLREAPDFRQDRVDFSLAYAMEIQPAAKSCVELFRFRVGRAEKPI